MRKHAVCVNVIEPMCEKLVEADQIDALSIVQNYRT